MRIVIENQLAAGGIFDGQITADGDISKLTESAVKEFATQFYQGSICLGYLSLDSIERERGRPCICLCGWHRR